MAQVTLPNVNQTGTNQWEDVEGNDRALRDAINGDLDNSNMATAAAVAISKLASGTSAQLIVCNASGVPTYAALSGDATISNTGVLTLGADSVSTAEIAANAVGSSEIADANVTDAKLASPNNSVYHTIHEAYATVGNNVAAGTYYLRGETGPVTSDTSGTSATISTAWSTATPTLPAYFYFDDADYTVASKTPKLRVRAQIAVNATAPTINFTIGLYPITVAGGADALTFTLGTVTTGSTVALNTPSTSTITQGNSGDFTIPSDGAYALGVVLSGQLPSNSATLVSAQVQRRSV